MNDKGKALEKAVALIEGSILRSKPQLTEENFIIERNKILVVNGVKHEIDVHVEIDLADGYKCIFIFECKNWTENVGKNEIIEFIEKIKVSKAQKGFFVGTGFGEYALAQARLEPRLELLKATDFDLDNSVFPILHYVGTSIRHTELLLRKRGSEDEPEGRAEAFEVPDSVLLRGEKTDLKAFVSEEAKKIVISALNGVPTGLMPEGTHDYTHERDYEFSCAELLIGDLDVSKMKIRVHWSASIQKPKVISKFNIQTRGRCVELSPFIIGNGAAVEMSMVAAGKR